MFFDNPWKAELVARLAARGITTPKDMTAKQGLDLLESSKFSEYPPVKNQIDSLGVRYTVSNEVYWRYDMPSRGSKIFLLTQGGMAVDGIYKPNGGFIGWHPLFKRDRVKESESKELWLPNRP